MFALLAIGIAVAVVGAVMLAEEWRRAGTQHARLNKLGLRFEFIGGGAVLIGVGVAIAHAGVGS